MSTDPIEAWNLKRIRNRLSPLKAAGDALVTALEAERAVRLRAETQREESDRRAAKYEAMFDMTNRDRLEAEAALEAERERNAYYLSEGTALADALTRERAEHADTRRAVREIVDEMEREHGVGVYLFTTALLAAVGSGETSKHTLQVGHWTQSGETPPGPLTPDGRGYLLTDEEAAEVVRLSEPHDS